MWLKRLLKTFLAARGVINEKSARKALHRRRVCGISLRILGDVVASIANRCWHIWCSEKKLIDMDTYREASVQGVWFCAALAV